MPLPRPACLPAGLCFTTLCESGRAGSGWAGRGRASSSNFYNQNNLFVSKPFKNIIILSKATRTNYRTVSPLLRLRTEETTGRPGRLTSTSTLLLLHFGVCGGEAISTNKRRRRELLASLGLILAVDSVFLLKVPQFFLPAAARHLPHLHTRLVVVLRRRRVQRAKKKRVSVKGKEERTEGEKNRGEVMPHGFDSTGTHNLPGQSSTGWLR